jgi:NADH-quinone oxidoreductase subunit L
MIDEPTVWAILFIPLGAFLFLSLVIRPFLNGYARWAGYLSVFAVALAFCISLVVFRDVLTNPHSLSWDSHTWISIGDMDIRVGIFMDPLTSIMLLVVTGVSFLVQIYSQGYMRGDPGYTRYFALMSLFTASMVGIVLSRSILQLYVFWELVGLSSYLLIGFWYHWPAAAAAAKKAFLVTRIGDVGLLLAILYLFSKREIFLTRGLNPFEIPDIISIAVEPSAVALIAVTWLALGIFAGAVGKSGQFPLHTWLPDAMEGPTPVSALIHAATMVAAGVFLVARMFPVFSASETAMTTVAIVGGFTALFAASMALVMFDIKRVLAYSTVSQLGYMMLALGVGAPSVAIFHLFTHAFFKSLLFLGAGSVNHATGTFDMRLMGGLRKRMPWTYWTFLVGALSLAGLFPLAGYWSKEEILLSVWTGAGLAEQIIFGMSVVGVFMTAFYIFRVFIMTFHGEYRGGAEAEHLSGSEEPVLTGVTSPAVVVESHGHLQESSWIMVGPMVVLALATVVGGYAVNPFTNLGVVPAHWFVEFLGGHSPKAGIGIASVSTFLVLAGILLAGIMYQWEILSPNVISRKLHPIRNLLMRKYYVDYVYEEIIAIKFSYKGLARVSDWMDREVIDKVVDGVGWLGRNTGRGLTKFQSGQVQAYGVTISVGILGILGAYLLWG